jgi:membrane-associated protein
MGFDLIGIIRTFGYVGLIAIIFAESGLFFGFFLPGDSLLLTAGLLASRGELSLVILLLTLPVAAVLGDNVGFWFGKKVGPAIFNRDNSLLFRRKNLLAAKAFYDKHGGKTITVARFVPFIRTFVPIVAGAVEMNYRRFFFFNLLGGLVWAAGMTVVGYTLGRSFPPEILDRYFLLILVVVIFVSALPAMVHAWKEYRHEVWDFIVTRWKRLWGKKPELNE